MIWSETLSVVRVEHICIQTSKDSGKRILLLLLLILLLLLTSRTSWSPLRTEKVHFSKHTSKWTISTEYWIKDVKGLSSTYWATHHWESSTSKRILLLLSSKWKVAKRSCMCLLLLLLSLLILLVLLFVLLLLPFTFFFSLFSFLLSILTRTHPSLMTDRDTRIITYCLNISEVFSSPHIGRCKWSFLFLFFLRLHLCWLGCLFKSRRFFIFERCLSGQVHFLTWLLYEFNKVALTFEAFWIFQVLHCRAYIVAFMTLVWATAHPIIGSIWWLLLLHSVLISNSLIPIITFYHLAGLCHFNVNLNCL